MYICKYRFVYIMFYICTYKNIYCISASYHPYQQNWPPIGNQKLPTVTEVTSRVIMGGGLFTPTPETNNKKHLKRGVFAPKRKLHV